MYVTYQRMYFRFGRMKYKYRYLCQKLWIGIWLVWFTLEICLKFYFFVFSSCELYSIHTKHVLNTKHILKWWKLCRNRCVLNEHSYLIFHILIYRDLKWWWWISNRYQFSCSLISPLRGKKDRHYFAITSNVIILCQCIV